MLHAMLSMIAIAIAATVITDFIHEDFGHRGICVTTGVQLLMLSSVYFECSARNSGDWHEKRTLVTNRLCVENGGERRIEVCGLPVTKVS